MLPAYRDALAGGADYALILADYSIPGVAPRETLRHARQTHPELPFLFLTGRSARIRPSRC